MKNVQTKDPGRAPKNWNVPNPSRGGGPKQFKITNPGGLNIGKNILYKINKTIFIRKTITGS